MHWQKSVTTQSPHWWWLQQLLTAISYTLTVKVMKLCFQVYHIFCTCYILLISDILTYYVFVCVGHYCTNTDGIPPDGTPSTVLVSIQPVVIALTHTMLVAGLALAMICLVFNIVYRNRRWCGRIAHVGISGSSPLLLGWELCMVVFWNAMILLHAIISYM